jgi:hypothetical protein
LQLSRRLGTQKSENEIHPYPNYRMGEHHSQLIAMEYERPYIGIGGDSNKRRLRVSTQRHDTALTPPQATLCPRGDAIPQTSPRLRQWWGEVDMK